MKSITIKGSERESVGKKATKALRDAGKVPCVLYGGDKLIHFSAPELTFKNLVYTPNVYTAKIEIGKDSYNAVLQDIQFHPVTDKILHIDMYELSDDKEVTMNIPVRLTGSSKGVMAGGSLRHNLRKLRLKAIPANLPDYVEVDITNLEIGGKTYVTKLKNENYVLLHPDNTVVVQVRTSRNVAKQEENAEAEDKSTEEQS